MYWETSAPLPSSYVGIKRIGDLMRQGGLRAKAAKKFQATTNSEHSKPVAENTLNRDFTATAPNQKWVGDIPNLGFILGAHQGVYGEKMV